MTDYNDGKIHGWNGGTCPVHPKTEVEYWMRGGDKSRNIAKTLDWSHAKTFRCYDIIAFRVTKIHREPKTIWVNEYSEDNRGVAYFSEEEAKEHVKYCTRIAVKYQEVIENE